jgi:uncharacterized protein (TIGR02611 family)
MAVDERAPRGAETGAVRVEPPEPEVAKPKLVARLERQRARHAQRPKVVRVLYVLAGLTLLLGGLGMVVLPGPAFVVIPIGLALLSLEFRWAKVALEKALVQATKAQRRAKQSTPAQRALSVAALALAVAAFVAWALLGDVPLLPV